MSEETNTEERGRIVPIEEEQEAESKTAAMQLLQQFTEQWTLETMPACDEGMALLMQFADAHPGAYQLASQRGFVDVSHPMFKRLAKWQAFAQHVSSCPKCNEV